MDLRIYPTNRGWTNVDWENKILLLFHELDGMTTLKKIYELIEKRQDMFPLKPKHFEPTKWGGRPAFEHQVRSHISNLRQSGDLRWIDTGKYELTERGLKRVKFYNP